MNYFESEEYKASEVYRKQNLDNLINDDGDIYESAINDAFIAGAHWMKNNIKKIKCYEKE